MQPGTNSSSGIRLSNVSFSYPGMQKTLDNISLVIQKGGFLGITGTNGSGKSTLTYLLNGLIPHFIRGNLDGTVNVDDYPTDKYGVTFLAGIVGMVFQNPDFSLFNLSVGEEISFGLKNFKSSDLQEKVRRSLDMVGLKGFENRDPQSLSLGEKQKVCLAAVLALNTPYIVLDEPSAMLDFRSSLEIYHILGKLNRNGTTVIVVEHDTDLLSGFTKQTAIMDKGRIIAQGSTKSVLGNTKILKTLGIRIPGQRSICQSR